MNWLTFVVGLIALIVGFAAGAMYELSRMYRTLPPLYGADGAMR